MKFKGIIYSGIAAALFLSACTAEKMPSASVPGTSGDAVRVSLSYGSIGQDSSSPAVRAQSPAHYDHVEFLVCYAADGNAVKGLKGFYDKETSSIEIEGLRAGEYRLNVLGIKGDSSADGAVINRISNESDVWISFPEDLGKPLAAEYFYSSTPFRVEYVPGPEGGTPSVDIPGSVEQKRIVGRMDFSVEYRNPYVGSAALSETAVLDSPRFYTSMGADGSFSGKSDGTMAVLDLQEASGYLFMPAYGGEGISGKTVVRTRDYRGGVTERSYTFTSAPLVKNTISPVSVDAVHPDDNSGTMFMTERHYQSGNYALILQDDEPHEIYVDKTQRYFNTSEPLQIELTDDGRLHIRFYSPRDLSGVLVKALVPELCGEYIDLAYFDRIPAFADFYEVLPFMEKDVVCRTESGRLAGIAQCTAESLAGASFKVESEDPYWEKLQNIIHGWNIRFDLYGGDPTQPDGGPKGNWMGIRPVHCREAVALFLNFTYMIDMPEHEKILRDNQDRLYGNGGVNDKVTPETVLAQMRQNRTINVGLVYTGNNVYGLGGGQVFGAYQAGWLNHYTSRYACEVMFHELGHVMGYSHNSAFTYGPWAQELMNNFYVDHLSELPIDSAAYLNSRQNPNLYPREPMAAALDAGYCMEGSGWM